MVVDQKQARNKKEMNIRICFFGGCLSWLLLNNMCCFLMLKNDYF